MSDTKKVRVEKALSQAFRAGWTDRHTRGRDNGRRESLSRAAESESRAVGEILAVYDLEEGNANPPPKGFLRHEAEDTIERWAGSKARTARFWEDVLKALVGLEGDHDEVIDETLGRMKGGLGEFALPDADGHTARMREKIKKREKVTTEDGGNAPPPKDDKARPVVWIVRGAGENFAVKATEKEAEDALDALLSSTGREIEEGQTDIERWVVGEVEDARLEITLPEELKARAVKCAASQKRSLSNFTVNAILFRVYEVEREIAVKEVGS